MDISEKLLALAAAVSWDGGEQVVRVVRSILSEMAPFDAGEIAVSRVVGFERWTLTDEESPIVAEDLLLHVSRGAHLRFDDLHEAEAFPRTRERLASQGLRSLLALPLSAAGGPEGALVLARRQGWGFVGASLQALSVLVGMTGLSLERAAALTALRRKILVLEERVRQLGDDLEATRRNSASPPGQAEKAAPPEEERLARQEEETRTKRPRT